MAARALADGDARHAPLPAARGGAAVAALQALPPRRAARASPTACRCSSAWGCGCSRSAPTASPRGRRRAGVDPRLRPASPAARTSTSPRSPTLFEDAFGRVFAGEIESDGFNRLVLAARLAGGPDHRAARLCEVPAADRLPAVAGVHRADARRASRRSRACWSSCSSCASIPPAHEATRAPRRCAAIEAALEAVENLNEDRVLRQYLALMQATLRTNYWRRDADGRAAPFLSFKIDPAKVPGLPEPKPLFEIFVYSPRFEGIHLRGGKIARGGLRWSDRPEDFRTEVLGLVKAQMVKNTVIVPVGSKGGFVLKRAPPPTRPRGVPGRGRRLLQGVPVRAARPHRQHRRRARRAAAAGAPPRSRRSVPRGRRRQGDGDVLRLRQRRLARTTGSGSATRSPPAARSATTTRRWASPRAARGSR